MTSPPIVYVVDDDNAFRKSLTRLLSIKGYHTLSFASAEEFIDAGISGHGCILLDVRMPGLSGLQLQERLRLLPGLPPIIFITGHASVPMSVMAMKGGAEDFLTKPIDDTTLFAAVDTALDRSAKRSQAESAISDLKQRFTHLSPRQMEVFAHVVRGRLNKQIAFDLGTTERTIKAHRAQVMMKMGATSIQQLVAMAQKLGV